VARYPHAHWRPLPEAGNEPAITARQVILHTAVSNAGSLFDYFARADVAVESHFYVSQNGCEQYIDTARQADANRNANARAISIETWDAGDPAHTPWTPRQLDLLVDLVAWCCRTHGIPARRCTSPTAPGIGWHTMWGAPSEWTPAAGKTCPGAPRIAQIPDLIRRVQLKLSGAEEDDMTPAQEALLRNAAADAAQARVYAKAAFDLAAPNGFRYAIPTTGEEVAEGTPGARPVGDVWRWTRESVIEDREEEDRHEHLVHLLEELHPGPEDTPES
jgi:hypothetical protein